MENSAEELRNKVIEIQRKQLQRNNSHQKTEITPSPVPITSEINSGQDFVGIERIQKKLFDASRNDRYHCTTLYQSSEYPTIFTRIPIFIPGQPARQQKLLDKENALPFSTSWGSGRRHGPPLTIYDEDTLIAISLLRHFLLSGDPTKFPIQVSSLAQSYHAQNDPQTRVHVVTCTLSDIQAICGTSKGGKNNSLRLASIKRLAATSIEFTETTKNARQRGTTFRLIDVAWDSWEEDAVLYIQITPTLAKYLEKEFTYIDWQVRCQLTGLGKAIHRFLSGQPKSYQISLLKLKEVIYFQGEHKEFTRQLRVALKKLREIEWLNHWEISGTASKRDQKLIISR